MAKTARVAFYSLVFASLSAPVGAKDKDKDLATAPPAIFQGVLDCRSVADAAARLACFDKSVAVMADATAKKDLVVIDRATIRETKRGLFGISLPSIKIFGGNDDVEVNQIESTLTSARSSSDGLTVFLLADGSRWKQTEGRYTYPKPGQKIVVKRGALGGFLANVNDQPAVRVMRLAD
ncbi:hypothetical protein [Novosphingobium sp.]|uniref:hypothetical protein n=1 Tax=Novosphingobium sp. TaxID=1874826 RepID=UPI00286D7C7A|nr:hypothetical protein [Novosphingobium sp.]